MSLIQQIRDALVQSGGMTAAQLADALGEEPKRVRDMCNEAHGRGVLTSTRADGSIVFTVAANAPTPRMTSLPKARKKAPSKMVYWTIRQNWNGELWSRRWPNERYAWQELKREVGHTRRWIERHCDWMLVQVRLEEVDDYEEGAKPCIATRPTEVQAKRVAPGQQAKSAQGRTRSKLTAANNQIQRAP